MMNKFTMEPNDFLRQPVKGFYRCNFYGHKHPDNPNFLYKLKNDPHHTWNSVELQRAVEDFKKCLVRDLTGILLFAPSNKLTLCTVPRAKAEHFYRANQLLFKATVSEIACTQYGYHDGTDFIRRHTNTKTTHLRNQDNSQNDGSMPYPGIAKATCSFSSEIAGRDILLVDDIYTRTVNIDEDMAQALFDHGAKTVTFYAIGYTVKKVRIMESQ